MIRVVATTGCAERALVARLVARCAPAALRARLFVPEGRRLGPQVVDLLAGPAHGVGYLAMDEHRPVGLANMVPDPHGGPVELALLVADRWRRQGVGRELVGHALADPRWAGRAVQATVQPENLAVLGLLRSCGLRLRLVDTAPGELYFQLRPADAPGRASGPAPLVATG
jgi:GNAT superfamily N-acetyltransferase